MRSIPALSLFHTYSFSAYTPFLLTHKHDIVYINVQEANQNPRCTYSPEIFTACLVPGAYEPGASNYVERHLHLRAFSAFRIRTVLDYGEYPVW